TPAGQAVAATRPGPRVLLRTWLWGWLAVVQLVGDLLLAAPYLVLFGVMVAGISSIPAFGFGLLMVVPVLLISLLVGAFERLRVLAFVGVPVPAPGPPRQPTLWRRLLLDHRSWRATLHLTLISFWGVTVGSVTVVLLAVSLALAALPLYRAALPYGTLALPAGGTLPAVWWVWLIGVAGLLVLPLVARGLVGVDLALARWLLGPGNSEQVSHLTQRVETLTQTREAAVDSVELERRRIERDLHDGPQQRLVAIAMDLGMAKAKLADDPESARELLDKAHAASKEAIIEMRQVARGIHPPVLTDRGLDAALSALAARSPVPVTMRVALTQRPAPTIEAIAYFSVSEALTNVAKHSGARSAQVEVGETDGALQVVVSDDGRGGADPSRGTGLSGLRQRLSAVDGTLSVDSPPGGGTRLTMRLPQAHSTPDDDTHQIPRSTP
ncbi:MAG TPA: histidine kinase, partial [Kineosporiaceae bacterium]|nr:histidine kinase [Kineosporiaceae bacterium]